MFGKLISDSDNKCKEFAVENWRASWQFYLADELHCLKKRVTFIF